MLNYWLGLLILVYLLLSLCVWFGLSLFAFMIGLIYLVISVGLWFCGRWLFDITGFGYDCRVFAACYYSGCIYCGYYFVLLIGLSDWWGLVFGVRCLVLSVGVCLLRLWV